MQLPTLIIPNFWYDSWIFPWKQFSALLGGDTRTIRGIDLVRVEVLHLNRLLHTPRKNGIIFRFLELLPSSNFDVMCQCQVKACPMVVRVYSELANKYTKAIGPSNNIS